MTITSKDWTRILVVGLVILITTAIFTFFYGQKYQSDSDAAAKKEILAKNKLLQDSIANSNQRVKLVQDSLLILAKQLKDKKVEYVQINNKYDKISNLVKSMPPDEQVKFLTEWVSQADSLSR